MDNGIYRELIESAERDRITKYVVGAIVPKGNKILLLERPKSDFMDGIYELPSGKVEEGESLDAALGREVKEETGLEVKEITRYVGHFDYESKRGRTRQFTFVVHVDNTDDVRLFEHDSYAWASENDIEKYPVTDEVKALLKSFWDFS